jgi:hypothetical protein
MSHLRRAGVTLVHETWLNRALSTGELEPPQLYKLSEIVYPPQTRTVQAQQQQRVSVKQELGVDVKQVLHHVLSVYIIMTLLAAYEGQICAAARGC